MNKAFWIFLLLLTGCQLAFKGAEVTYYVGGNTTYDGSAYEPTQFTCAVRDKADLHKWLRFEYQGKVVYCWTNDLMPQDSKAAYDLSPAAFMMLAPIYKGRLKGVYVDYAE